MSTATPPTQAPSPAPDKRRKRLASYTVRNMVLSVLPVAALALVWWSIPFNPPEQVRPNVETEQTARYVVEQSDFPVWVPQPGQDWTPTVAWYDTRYDDLPTWHISYESPEGEYLALTQAASVSPEWLEEVLRGGALEGSVEIPGPEGVQTFERYAGPRPSNAELAWLLGPEDSGGSTIVVHGTAAAQDELEEFLRSVQVED